MHIYNVRIQSMISCAPDPTCVSKLVTSLLLACRKDGGINDNLLASTLDAILSDERLKAHLKTKEDYEKDAIFSCLRDLATVSKETVQNGAGVYAEK